MSLTRRIALPVLTALVAGFGLSAGAQAATAPSTTAAATSGSAVAPPTAASVPRIAARVLRPGAKGADVTRLQQLLAAVGITTSSTGQYLADTSLAIQHFQYVARLKPSGIAGPATISALRAAALGPRTVEASGGLGFGQTSADTLHLGDRIPLAAGMSGPDVRQLQTYLKQAHVKGAGVVDGEFGPKVAAAIKRFEASAQRRVDGSVDAGDLFALLVAVGAASTDTTAPDPTEGLPPAPLAPGDRATVASDGTATAPASAPDAVKQIIAAGNLIAKLPYKWGGGHGRWSDNGYDCSGSVSYALHGAGLLKSPLASYDYFGWGQGGPGQWVTLYTNSGHIYMVVAGLRFDTSGRGPHGSRWQADMRDNSGFRVRHPAGL